MKATLEPTDQITQVDSIPCRIWQGQTDLGVRFFAFVALVAVEREQDCAEFERFLKEVAVVRQEIVQTAASPLRRIL